MIEEAAIQVREAARELEHYGEALEVDAARQEVIERRLAAMEELARKHRVPAGELPGHAAGAAGGARRRCERADTDLARTAQGARRRTAGISHARRRRFPGAACAAARALARDITARMQTLGMAGGRFEADVTPDASGEPAQHGIDQIEFRVSANPGQPPRALAKVASGGELSRLSLAVQVSCAATETRCMVFDEVDAGIGGAVAEIVGRELRSLGARGQVLCVTHLPQVACQAHHHLRVSKLSDGRTTRTTLTELTARSASRSWRACSAASRSRQRRASTRATCWPPSPLHRQRPRRRQDAAADTARQKRRRRRAAAARRRSRQRGRPAALRVSCALQAGLRVRNGQFSRRQCP